MPFSLWFLKLDVLFCPGDSIPLFSPCPTIMVIQNLLYFHFFETSTLSHRKKRKLHVRAQIWYYNYITRRSAIKADRIITVSENAKKEITEYFKINGEKIFVVYHGLSPHFKEYIKDSEKVKVTIEKYKLIPGYVLYVGAIVPHKNIDTIISAFSILKDRYSMKCQLVMAGSDHAGYSEHLKSIGKTSGVLEQMNFLGHVAYKELPALYNKAKVFVMLSLCESFGLPLLEAMACDCPVICSNVSSLPEIAGNGAILVDPKDPIKIAEAIKVLMEDQELRRDMIIKGKRRADEFSWRKGAYRTLKVIEDAVDMAFPSSYNSK
ncbi:glycosyltransferase family 4 protein, partial [Candidatus Poribacteria bacterium]|nr:glycosyltransferase family 4 protein [Candidatus Poribacteria bacterium]